MDKYNWQPLRFGGFKGEPDGTQLKATIISFAISFFFCWFNFEVNTFTVAAEQTVFEHDHSRHFLRRFLQILNIETVTAEEGIHLSTFVDRNWSQSGNYIVFGTTTKYKLILCFE